MAAVADDVRLIGGNLNGRYTLGGGRKGLSAFACRAQSISPRSIALAAPVSGAIDEPVNIHFNDFGILHGKITRLLDFGFVLDLIATDEERAKIAAKIRWLKKRTAKETTEQRTHQRVLPRSPRSALALPDGTKMECFIIDMSPSGVAVSADITPQVGQPIAVGRAVGRVVRHLDVGFAVQFAAVQDAASLDKVLQRPD